MSFLFAIGRGLFGQKKYLDLLRDSANAVEIVIFFFLGSGLWTKSSKKWLSLKKELWMALTEVNLLWKSGQFGFVIVFVVDVVVIQLCVVVDVVVIVVCVAVCIVEV